METVFYSESGKENRWIVSYQNLIASEQFVCKEYFKAEIKIPAIIIPNNDLVYNNYDLLVIILYMYI